MHTHTWSAASKIMWPLCTQLPVMSAINLSVFYSSKWKNSNNAKACLQSCSTFNLHLAQAMAYILRLAKFNVWTVKKVHIKWEICSKPVWIQWALNARGSTVATSQEWRCYIINPTTIKQVCINNVLACFWSKMSAIFPNYWIPKVTHACLWPDTLPKDDKVVQHLITFGLLSHKSGGQWKGCSLVPQGERGMHYINSIAHEWCRTMTRFARSRHDDADAAAASASAMQEREEKKSRQWPFLMTCATLLLRTEHETS